jgi:hypothetical protein
MNRALIFICFLAACREEQRTPTTFTQSTEQTATHAGDTAVIAAPVIANPRDTLPVPPGSNAVIRLALAPITRVQLHGSAILKGLPNATSFDVTLQAANGGTMSGNVRLGTCENPGPSVASLNPVSIDSLGSGRAAGDFPIPIDSLIARPHVIVFGAGLRPEACGAIHSP